MSWIEKHDHRRAHFECALQFAFNALLKRRSVAGPKAATLAKATLPVDRVLVFALDFIIGSYHGLGAMDSAFFCRVGFDPGTDNLPGRLWPISAPGRFEACWQVEVSQH